MLKSQNICILKFVKIYNFLWQWRASARTFLLRNRNNLDSSARIYAFIKGVLVVLLVFRYAILVSVFLFELNAIDKLLTVVAGAWGNRHCDNQAILCVFSRPCDQKLTVTFFLFRHTLAVQYLSPLE